MYKKLGEKWPVVDTTQTNLDKHGGLSDKYGCLGRLRTKIPKFTHLALQILSIRVRFFYREPLESGSPWDLNVNYFHSEKIPFAWDPLSSKYLSWSGLLLTHQLMWGKNNFSHQPWTDTFFDKKKLQIQPLQQIYFKKKVAFSSTKGQIYHRKVQTKGKLYNCVVFNHLLA